MKRLDITSLILQVSKSESVIRYLSHFPFKTSVKIQSTNQLPNKPVKKRRTYSSTPNNRADPNKRAGRKFQSLLMQIKGKMDTFCGSKH